MHLEHLLFDVIHSGAADGHRDRHVICPTVHCQSFIEVHGLLLLQLLNSSGIFTSLMASLAKYCLYYFCISVIVGVTYV